MALWTPPYPVDPLTTHRVRGHRHVGPIEPRREGRHYLWAAAIIAIVGAGVSAYAASEQAAAQERQAKYNQKVAQNQAQAAQNAAQVAEENQREHDRRVLAQQRALVGGAGLDSSGSALLVMIDSAKQAELDAVRVKYGGNLQASGLEDQAQLFGMSAQQARKAGQIAVGTTLLTGASNVAGAYGRYGTGTKPTYGGANYGGYSSVPY